MAAPRVLIVDPDLAFAQWLGQNLGMLGVQVQLVADCNAGLAQAARWHPEMLVVDAFLPGLGGKGFMQALRKQEGTRTLAALFTAIPTHLGLIGPQTIFGIDEFIAKDARIEEYVERLRRLQGRLGNLSEVALDLGRYAGGLVGIDTLRRQRLSVMFTDVRGFTTFSESKDPETVAAALNQLFELQVKAVNRYGGSVDKFIGDGMMAIFGLQSDPTGEDFEEGDCELAATYAAQDIVDAIAESETVTLLAKTKLAIGVGLHTGEAVVGPIGPASKRDFTAIGDTVNIAARLCSEAGPGEIVVSEEHFTEIEPKVEVTARRDAHLKGKRQEQRIYAVRLRR